MKLSKVVTGSQTVELIEPRDSDSRYLRSLRLLLRDTATGALTELTIEPDALALPDEVTLVLSVMDIDEPHVTAEHGEFVDDGQSVVVEEVEPRVEWMVTPRGEEVDLRGDGLFG